MELRPELRPELCPPQVPPHRVAELCVAIDNITRLLDRGEPTEAQIAAFNAATGGDYAAEDFICYWESCSTEEFARDAATPAPPKVPDVTREELAEVVRRVEADDDDSGYYLLVLETNVVHPRVGDLIFWPPPELVGASAEQIVDVALSYKPIAL